MSTGRRRSLSDPSGFNAAARVDRTAASAPHQVAWAPPDATPFYRAHTASPVEHRLGSTTTTAFQLPFAPHFALPTTSQLSSTYQQSSERTPRYPDVNPLAQFQQFSFQASPAARAPIASTSGYHGVAEEDVDEGDGLQYSIEVVQHPLRARMCGFGDRDRRPLTPPLIVKLVVRTPDGQPMRLEETSLGFYVCAADLWDEDGTNEANFVSQTSSSSASTAADSPVTSISRRPALPEPPLPLPTPTIAYPLPSPDLPYLAHRRDSTSSGMPSGSTSAPVTPDGAFLPQFGAQQTSSLLGAVFAQHHEFATYGQHLAPQSYSPYELPKPTYAPPPMPAIPTPAPLPSVPAASTSGSMCNLIGALQSSAHRLKGTDKVEGIYFVFPDLSVRTEGRYTVRLQLMSLGGDDFRIRPTADVLATTFSDPFEVTTAKKFQGMVEPTALSTTFAAQGVRIPTRRVKRGGNNSDDD